jgi:hypothetical protein
VYGLFWANHYHVLYLLINECIYALTLKRNTWTGLYKFSLFICAYVSIERLMRKSDAFSRLEEFFLNITKIVSNFDFDKTLACKTKYAPVVFLLISVSFISNLSNMWAFYLPPNLTILLLFFMSKCQRQSITQWYRTVSKQLQLFSYML